MKNKEELYTWIEGRFKDFVVLQRGKDLTDSNVVPGAYPVVKSNGIDIYHNQYFVEPPGVVTGRSGTIGNAFYLTERFWAHNTALYVKDFKGNDPQFIYYLIVSMNLNKHLAGTTVPTLNRNDIHRLKIKIPNQRKEQSAISSILSKVDEAIEAVENSIKSAEKIKKGLMQNLLTGKLKTDGTWRKDNEFYVDTKFGRVPVGWVMKAVGDNSHCDINPNYKFTKGREYDFIPMEAVNDSFGGVTNLVEKRIIDSGGYTRYKKGDVLFAKITPCTENGKVALIKDCETEIGFASTEFIVFRPKETIDNLFLYYLLSSSSVHMLAVSLMEGTTGRQRVPSKVFKNRIFVPIPTDINEQKAIAEIISSIETQNQSKTSKIDSLKRLKKSLMQNLLTGKAKVEVSKLEIL